MSSLNEIKSRIASVRNTLKITSAMKMVASAKLHKAQVAIGGKLPYEQQLHRILSGLLQDDELHKAMHDKLGFGNPHGHSAVVLQDIGLDQIPTKDVYPRIAIVAFSSNSSLCGAFNANAIKKFYETVKILEVQGYDRKDICRKTGYGSHNGCELDGQRTDQKTAGYGKRKTLRYGKPGGYGKMHRKHLLHGGCIDENQQ